MKSHSFRLTAIALLFALVACRSLTAAAETMPTEMRARLAATVAEFREQAGPPAVTVLIDRGGETVFTTSLGLADVGDRRAPSADAVYAIGSITKSFTALATLQLVHEGRLRLDDTVSKLLPDYAGPGGAVTVRHLLDHTSGLPNYTSDVPGLYPRLERNAWTRADLVATFASLPLQFEPGSRWSYTNSGYYLLGLIIEKVSGLDYYEYLRTRVFAPLGMRQSFSGDDAEIVADRVRGYRMRDGRLLNAAPWHYLVPFAAGSLLSTASDLARYRRGVFTSEAFPPALRELVVRTVPLSDGTPNLYALGGLISSSFHGHRKLSHSGEIFGFHSNHAYYPDEDLTIIVLTNRMGLRPSPVSLENRIARIVLGIPAPDRRPVPVTQEELAAYTGDYELRPFLFGPPQYSFAVENGGLVLKIGGPKAPGMPLVAIGGGRFVSALDDEWQVEFDRPRRGQPAVGFRMNVADGTLTGSRSAP
jgi:CubicO group peptidase (beta-lactamase class C family)